MSQSVRLPKDINIDSIEFGSLNVLQNGAKTVYMNCKGNPIVTQIPWMKVPFGLSKYAGNDDAPKGEREKWSLQLAFQDLETNKSMGNFFKFLQSLDNTVLNASVANSKLWFKKDISKEVLRELCTSLIIYPKDKKTGEITDAYPPMCRLSIPVVNGIIACPCYNKDKEKVDLATIEKGSKVSVIVQWSGVWIAGSKCGTTGRVIQLLVEPPTHITGYAFVNDLEDPNGLMNENPTYVDSSSDEEDDLDKIRKEVPAPAPSPEDVSLPVEEDEVVPLPPVVEDKKAKGKKK